MPARIWIAEDNATYRGAVARALSAQDGMTCEMQFASGAALVEALIQHPRSAPPDVILLDVGLPDGSGIERLPAIRDAAPDCRVLILTAFEEEAKITHAICNGAQGYLRLVLQ